MLQIGDRIDRYVIEGHLSDGGLSTIYRVRHVGLDTRAALKVLNIGTAGERNRLLAEGRVQAKLRHPNLVPVTDLLLVFHSPALVMELIEGPTLEDRLARGPMAPEQVISIFQGIVAGIGTAHAAGVVHRDLKPNNVLLEQVSASPEEWQPRITDFGLVKLLGRASNRTLTGAPMGTPAYMAPEQIRDASSVDHRADLWALGCLLYEMTCGMRAFPDDDTLVLYNAIATGDYADPVAWAPRASDRVIQTIRGLLQVDPDNRIASCPELWERLFEDPIPETFVPEERFTEVDLKEWPSAEVVRAATHTLHPITKVVPPPRRSLGYLSGFVVLTLLIGLGLSLLAWRRPAIGVEEPTVVEDDEPVNDERMATKPPAFAPITAPRPDETVGPPWDGSPAPERAISKGAPSTPPEKTQEIPPSRVAPAPTPPAAPTAIGRVEVEANGASVRLESLDGTEFPIGDVPVGRYVVRALWSSDNTEAKTTPFTITDGSTTRIRCNPVFDACSVLR